MYRKKDWKEIQKIEQNLLSCYTESPIKGVIDSCSPMYPPRSRMSPGTKRVFFMNEPLRDGIEVTFIFFFVDFCIFLISH